MNNSKETQSSQIVFTNFHKTPTREYQVKLIQAIDYLNGLDNISKVQRFKFICNRRYFRCLLTSLDNYGQLLTTFDNFGHFLTFFDSF